ncbi:hypothetical protein [Flavobacterium sp.]|uniref:hypothetical protein n=1 Tax=Flavobacterium sp. TaxID=239 RepID=UPI00391ADECA
MEFQLELPQKLFTPHEIVVLMKYGEKLKSDGKVTFDYKKIDEQEINKDIIARRGFLERQKIFLELFINKTWEKYKILNEKWGELYAILNKANEEEIQILSKILKLKSASKEDIIPELINNSKNLFEFFDNDISYVDILSKIKRKLKLDKKITEVDKIEKAIAAKILEEALSKMTAEQKNELEKELMKIAEKESNDSKYKVGSVFAALTAAQASGFGVYLLATTSLGFLSGAIGITLPFATYTALTSAISVIIGPAGWISGGLYALWRLNDTDYKKIIPAVIYMGWLREKYSEL